MNVPPADKATCLEFLSELGLGVRATNVLLEMGVASAEQLMVLDEKTLLKRRNCGKRTAVEILDAAKRYEPPIKSDHPRTQSAPLLATMDPTPVSDLRLSVRATGALERLKISTIGELAKLSDRELLSVSNFGRKSLREVRSKLAVLKARGFVFWPTDQQRSCELCPELTQAAKKLSRLECASTLLSDDYRFGHLVREMSLDARNAREAADKVIRRVVDPIDPHPVTKRLIDLTAAAQANGIFLEEELWNLTEGLGSDRDRRIIVSHLGWDGKAPRTLEAVGEEHRMTRERVRQICTRIEKIQSSRPFAPALDRALHMVARSIPVVATEVEAQLAQCRLTESGFCAEALEAAARQLRREPSFTVEMLHGQRVVVPANSRGLFEQIDHLARAHIRHWGVATVEDLAATAGTESAFTRKLLSALPGFQWLDEPSGWFWISNTRQNSLLTQVRKILVAASEIDAGELRTGVGRHHHKKGFSPPRRVLVELCRQLPWCRVEGDRIAAATPLNPNEILSDSEQIILRVLREHGPVIQRAQFEQLCLDAGMNHHSFWVFLSYCPLICRHALGVYGLRGAEIPVGLVERLVPKRTFKSKLLVDYGWTGDRNVRVLYRVSEGMLINGIVHIPAALKAFVQGRFALMTGDNSRIGTLVVKDDSGWGLGPFFTRRGAESGDYLSIVFDLSEHVATALIGDASLTDPVEDSAPTVDGLMTHRCAKKSMSQPLRYFP